jgi:TPR repeat protein
MTYALLAAIVVFLSGCAAGPVSMSDEPGQVSNTNDLLVVDCLLPGQIRKLGQGLVYLSPRRPIKTTAGDCEIRGGEYVAYDRANYVTALKVWLPKAQEGDPVAQTYVGEIYEKGLGIEADYGIAARWYRKAAEQDNPRAQINLGYLYESGLGVPMDLTTAMNWYRKASGLRDGDLEYVSSVEVARREAAQRRAARTQEELVQLRGEFGRLQRDLKTKVAALARAQQDLGALRQRYMQAARMGAAEAPPVDPVREQAARAELQRRLQDARAEQRRLIDQLAQKQLESKRLRQQLEGAKQRIEQHKAERDATQRDLEGTRAELKRREAQTAAVEGMDQEVLRLRSELGQYESRLREQQKQLLSLDNKSRQLESRLTQELDQVSHREVELKASLEARDREVAGVQLQLLEKNEAISAYERRLWDAQREKERLSAQLAHQQLEAKRLNEGLVSAQDELTKRRNGLQKVEAELAQTRSELEHQRQVARELKGEPSVQRLEARVRDLQAIVQAQRRDMTWLETDMGEQRSQLGEELAQAQRNEAELQLALNTRTDEVASLKGQLGLVQQELAGASRSATRVNELREELLQREQEVSRQEKEIADLQALLSQRQSPQEKSEFAAVVFAEPVGPSIEIIEPPLTVMRGAPSIHLRSAVAEVELIGRVEPAAELMAFSLNDAPLEVNDYGLFKVSVKVLKPKTPVNVVAVDKKGKRAMVQFAIIPKDVARDANLSSSSVSAAAKPNAQAVDFGRFHALIIGNDNYQNLSNLSTARNDARAVEEILRTKYGFKTQLLLDADRYTMLSTLNRLREGLTDDDNLLIYYAGHGELDDVNLRGHWLPVDAEPDSTANWISNVVITDILNVMVAKHVLVVADSCYSGAMTRSSIARLQTGMSPDAQIKWYKVMSKTRARAVLTSGGLEPVLDVGAGEHSVFAKAFLDVLDENDGILEGFRLYREVQDRVKRATATLNIDQNPQYAPIKFAGHETGEFLFKPVHVTGLGPSMLGPLAMISTFTQ